MDFEALQTKFVKRHLDTRTVWAVWGADNLEALNDWYKEVYSNAIQDRSVQEIMKTIKTNVSLTDWVWTLPSDYLQPVKLYFKSVWLYQEIDKDDTPYRFQRTWWVNKIIFDVKPNFSVYIEYIPKLTELLANTDESVLPTEFDDDIIRYAMVEYHRAQRDWAEVWNELQYAEWKMQSTIDNFWLE